jgi:hypothetical protein
MHASLTRRLLPLSFAASLALVPCAANADLLPDGLLGVKLGQSRVEAVTALVNAGVVPDLEKAQCSDKVPEKNKGLVDRICKLAVMPGATYLGLPIAKVTFLFKDEAIVLMGLYLGESADTFGSLRTAYRTQFGPVTKEENPEILSWVEQPAPAVVRKTKVGLWADVPNAFMVYAYEDIR